MMNPDIRLALDDVLLAATEWKHTATDLHCFYPMKGASADGQLMLVGRALYGWSSNTFKVPDMESEEMRRTIIDDTFRISSGEGCPVLRFYQGCIDERLKDRKAYNVKSSSFWNIGQQVVRQFLTTPEEQENWPHYVYWTNLHKLSLAPTGNPPWSLRKVITYASLKMLTSEIEALQPKRILFLTGPWWAWDFLEKNPDFKREDTGPFPHARVYKTGFWRLKSLQEAAVVVADHPERKKRSYIFADVMEAFQRLEAV